VVGFGLSFEKSGLDLDRKRWQSAHLCSGHHTVNLSLFQIPVKWFKFFRFKSNPKIVLKNITQITKPNLVYMQILATVLSIPWRIALSTQCQLRVYNNIFFLQWTTRITRSFCEGCTWHHLDILVTAPLCCDWKARVASAQSFTLWQQATIEISRRAHSISACSHQIYMGVVLHAHPVRGESHI